MTDRSHHRRQRLAAEWQVGPIGGVDAPRRRRRRGTGFGSMLLGNVDPVAQADADATPPRRRRRSPPAQATDPTAVVMAVERAQLAMQLASQIRTKAVEAAQDIFHTQV